MSQPASNQSESSKLKQLLNGGVDDSIKSRLPRADAKRPAPPLPAEAPVSSAPAAPEPQRRRFHFLPAFWTIASVVSLTVNLVLLLVLLILLQMREPIQGTADNQITRLL